MLRLFRSAVAVLTVTGLGVAPALVYLDDTAYANDCQPEGSSFVGDGTNGTAGIVYQVLTFSAVGQCDWVVPEGVTSADVLIVAGGGGGGGGEWAGGGGGGGVLYGENLTVADYVSNGVIPITVGQGGAGGANRIDGPESRGQSGLASSFGDVTADGGGGGGGKGWQLPDGYDGTGLAGGSGGGVGEHGTPNNIEGDLIYALDNPTRDSSSDSLVYRTGFGLGEGDAARVFDNAGTEITRVSYRMTITVDGVPRFAEVRFNPWRENLTAYDLRVPDLTANERFEVQEVVKNMFVASNMSGDVSDLSGGITPGRERTGYLELWPWNFSSGRSDGVDSDGDPLPAGGDGSFDFNDTPRVNETDKGDHGSFQVHDVTNAGSEETLISWTLHRKDRDSEIGLGTRTSESPDWTNTKGLNGTAAPVGWSMEIRVNKAPDVELEGGASTQQVPDGLAGWTAYGHRGGTSETRASQSGSGGGGAGEPGGIVPFTSHQIFSQASRENRVAGAGGDGVAFRITGGEVYYAGGGGGGTSDTEASECALGGQGGGGVGGCSSAGGDGIDGLGGGGGGAQPGDGGDGGDGVVIVRYALNSGEPAVNLGSPVAASGDSVSIPVSLSNILTGTYQVFLSVPEGAGTLSITSNSVEALFGYDETSFARSNSRELGFMGSLTDVQAALDTLLFTPAEGNPAAQLSVDVTQAPAGVNAASMYYLPDTGHYYELVDQELHWGQARDAAQNRELFGLSGYLVTITSIEESRFLIDQVPKVEAWIGASDDVATVNAVAPGMGKEGDWFWVTGPEAGTQFWSYTGGDPSKQYKSGPSYEDGTGERVGGEFEAWHVGEPNNAGSVGEHFALINAKKSGIIDPTDEINWNDAAGDPYAGTTKRFIVEYGGMPGEESTSISASSSRWIVAEPPTGVGATVGEGSFTFSWAPPQDSANELTDYEYSTDSGQSWVQLGSTNTTVSVAVGDICLPLTFEVRGVIGAQVGESSARTTVSGCNTITIVESGGADVGSGWSFSAGLITATEDVSINASVISGYLNAGNLTVRSNGGDIIFDPVSVTKISGSDIHLTLQAKDVLFEGASSSSKATLTSQSGAMGITILAGRVVFEHVEIDANGGDIVVDAVMPSGPSGRAVTVTNSTVATSGVGSISISGDASLSTNTSSSAWGVTFGGNTTRIETEDGALTIAGVGGSQSNNSRGVVSDGQNFQILSENGLISIRDTLPPSKSDYSGAYFLPGTTNGIVFGSADGSSSSDIRFEVDRVAFAGRATLIGTAGNVTIAPNRQAFLRTLDTTHLAIRDNVAAVSLGKAGDSSSIVIGRELSADGPIAVYGNSITVQKPLTTTTDTVTFEGAAPNDLQGLVENTLAGTITADSLLVKDLHQVLLRTHENVSVDTFAARGVHRVLLVNQKDLTLGSVNDADGVPVEGISATEWVDIATTTGDLTVAAPVGTTASSSTWRLRLTAGASKDFGDGTGGDVKITHSPQSEAFAVPNAVTHVVSGSAAQSTNLAAVADALAVASVPPSVGVGEVAVAYRSGPPVFSSPTTLSFNDTLTLVVNDPAGTDVTLSKPDASDPCTLDAQAGTVLATGVGECVIRASNESGLFSEQTIVISRATQTVSFTSPVPQSAVAGTQYSPTAIATSGLATVIDISQGDSTVCSLSDSGIVTFSQSGTCQIRAQQPGNSNYFAAPAVTQTIVAGKINQTISFPTIDDKSFGDASFNAGATVSSGRTISYQSESTGVCTVGATTGIITLVAVGQCTITASSAGNGSFADASPVSRTFDVSASSPGRVSLTSTSFGNESISVGFTPPGFTGGSPITGYRAVATSSDGAEVTQLCSTASPCVIRGLQNGEPYSVTLSAVNEAGAGAASAPSPATIPANNPQAVADLTTQPGDRQLTVSWSPRFDYGGGNFSRYDVFIKLSGTADWGNPLEITEDTVDSTTFTTLGNGEALSNGVAYDVRVITITTANSQDLTSETVFALGIPMTTPGVVTELTVTALSATTATASWKAPTDDGGATITGYAVTPDCQFESPTDTVCVMSGLAAGSSVTVVVGATNLVGTGTATQAVVALPAPPFQPGSENRPGATRPPAPAPPLLPPGSPQPPVTPALGVAPSPAPLPSIISGPIPFPADSGDAAGPRSVIGGVPTQVEAVSRPGGGFDLRAGSLTLGIAPSLPSSNLGSNQGDGSFGFANGVPSQVRGGGLLPGSQLQFFMPALGSFEVGRVPVDGSGQFDSELSLRAGESGPPLPIGTHLMQMIGYDESGNQVIIEVPVNIAQGPPSPEWNLAVAGLPEVTPGEILATSAGLPEDVRVTVWATERRVDVSGEGWSFSLWVAGGTSSVSEGRGGPEIILTPSTSLQVLGEGFSESTRTDVWLFSDPTLLGSETVATDGAFDVEVYLDPRFATPGPHTLQLQAVGQDGFVKAVSLGVAIQSADSTTTDRAQSVVWLIGLAIVAILVLAVFVEWARRRARRAH